MTIDNGVYSRSAHFETLFAALPRIATYDPNLAWLLTPRPYIGANLSLQGKTNEFFAGFAWTAPLPAPFLLEMSFGGYIHDQRLFETYSDRPELTTRFLFRESISIGIEINQNWRLIAFADHASNGNLGYRNYPVNHVGLMLGNKFGPSPTDRLDRTPNIATFSWDGPYAGISGGLAWSSYTFVIDEPGAPGSPTNGGLHSLNVGGQFGYSWSFGPIVTGVEVGLFKQGLSGSTSRSESQPIDEQIAVATPWLATAQARIGLETSVLDRRFLVYGTGGLATARIAKSYCQRPANPCYINGDVAGGWMTEGGVRNGWTTGLGLETPLAPHISTRVEYLYASFGKLSYYNGPIRNDVEFSEQVIRAGINFQFAGD